MSKEKVPGFNYLHRHTKLEEVLNLDSDHVIVDKKDWEEVVILLQRMNNKLPKPEFQKHINQSKETSISKILTKFVDYLNTIGLEAKAEYVNRFINLNINTLSGVNSVSYNPDYNKVYISLKYYNDLVEGFNLNKLYEWVDVKDGLPDTGDFVLAYFPLGNKEGKLIDTTTYHGGKLTDTGSSVAHTFEATHWAKIPSFRGNS